MEHHLLPFQIIDVPFLVLLINGHALKPVPLFFIYEILYTIDLNSFFISTHNTSCIDSQSSEWQS